MSQVNERINVAKALASNIRNFAAGLSPEQLAAPSACSDWQVIDVVSHLIGGAERQLQSMRRGRAGDSGPPEGFVRLETTELSTTNAQRDIERRERLGNGVLDAFDQSHEELYQELDALGPDGWQTLCWHIRRGAMPAAEYVDLRIQELAIHDWDIRSAFDPEAGLSPDSLPALLDMSSSWLGMCFRPGPGLDESIVYRFELSGVPSGATADLVITVAGDRFDFSPGASADSVVSVSCAATDYLLLTYGRRSAAEGVASGKLRVEGDGSLLDRFEEWFKGV